MLGYSREEMMGTEMAAHIVPEDKARVLSNIHTGIESWVEQTMIRKDGARLIVEAHGRTFDYQNRKMRFTAIRDITDRKRLEDTQSFLATAGVATAGEDFFQALARFLSQNLGMDYVCIDRLQEEELAAQTVAVYFDGKFEENVRYALKDTPCGDVVGKTICCFPENVHQRFPNDAVLQEMQAQSYIGTTLWNSRGQPIGLIAIIGRQPMKDPKSATSVLQLVAVRAASELERKQADEATRRLNRTLKALASSSQAMSRATNEHQYTTDVCRIIVEDCGHALVWIGYAENDAAKSVRPVAWAGFEGGVS